MFLTGSGRSRLDMYQAGSGNGRLDMHDWI